ncbi:MAG: hypothetical protein JW854_10765 [Actinobacteria bacterium]|nr:hypothetical protein [Actinomycetota bacterium]
MRLSKLRLLKCPRCGFPLLFSAVIRWNDNGTICERMMPDLRAVLLEAELFNDLFERIEEKMGISISHLVFEAQRNAAKEVIDGVLNKFPFFLGRVGYNKKLVVRVFCDVALVTGQSFAKTVRYRPGREGEALIRNPYNRELMAAIILGAFESLEQKPFEHTWMEIDGDDVIVITASRDKPEVSERLAVRLPPLKPGNLSYPRCRICRVPSELSYLQWKEEDGIIMDTRRNVRMAFLDGYTPTTVFRELEKELGEEIYPVIVKAQKETTHRHLDELQIITKEDRMSPRGNRGIYEKVLAPLPLLGQGNPVALQHDDGYLRVTVENPYNEHLLAGHMAAVFEAVEGLESEVEWENPDPLTVVFTVHGVSRSIDT